MPTLGERNTDPQGVPQLSFFYKRVALSFNETRLISSASPLVAQFAGRLPEPYCCDTYNERAWNQSVVTLEGIRRSFDFPRPRCF